MPCLSRIGCLNGSVAVDDHSRGSRESLCSGRISTAFHAVQRGTKRPFQIRWIPRHFSSSPSQSTRRTKHFVLSGAEIAAGGFVSGSLQLCVGTPGLTQDDQVGIGALPQIEELAERLFCFFALALSQIVGSKRAVSRQPELLGLPRDCGV